MTRVLSRARVWMAVPLLAGGLFAFQSHAAADMGQHSKVHQHSHVEDHSKKCNPTEERHESSHAQAHEHEHGCP